MQRATVKQRMQNGSRCNPAHVIVAEASNKSKPSRNETMQTCGSRRAPRCGRERRSWVPTFRPSTWEPQFTFRPGHPQLPVQSINFLFGKQGRKTHTHPCLESRGIIWSRFKKSNLSRNMCKDRRCIYSVRNIHMCMHASIGIWQARYSEVHIILVRFAMD